MMKDLWKSHRATAQQQEQIEVVRKAFREAKEKVDELPECRHRSLCLTALEEAFMWAERAVIHWEPTKV